MGRKKAWRKANPKAKRVDTDVRGWLMDENGTAWAGVVTGVSFVSGVLSITVSLMVTHAFFATAVLIRSGDMSRTTRLTHQSSAVPGDTLTVTASYLLASPS